MNWRTDLTINMPREDLSCSIPRSDIVETHDSGKTVCRLLAGGALVVLLVGVWAGMGDKYLAVPSDDRTSQWRMPQESLYNLSHDPPLAALSPPIAPNAAARIPSRWMTSSSTVIRPPIRQERSSHTTNRSWFSWTSFPRLPLTLLQPQLFRTVGKDAIYGGTIE